MCGYKNGHQIDMCLKGLDYKLKTVNHSRLNIQHNWGDVYEHLTSMHTNLHSDNEGDIHMSSKNYEENG